jgi:hypothetical protein
VKKTQVLLFLLLFLSGCATYKFQKGESPFDQGYVVSRDGRTILEYTVGKDNSVPELESAKERFKRRKDSVELYYKKMGYIEDKFKQVFWDPPVMLVKFIGGIFRLPFIAASDYKYDHDPKYREKVTKFEEEQEAAKRKNIEILKAELNQYIQKDLEKEPVTIATQPKAEEIAMAKPEIAPQPEQATQEVTTALATTPVEPKTEQLQTKPATEAISSVPVEVETKPELEKEAGIVKPEEKAPAAIVKKVKVKKAKPKPPVLPSNPAAVIIAKPNKGFSPLKVHFYGKKSHSPNGKIVSYYWEFGDGDTSNKKNPINTYWSTTYETKAFTVMLTITDDKGVTATTSTTIEVMTK